MSETKNVKIIHYCWFGRNPLPELAKKCIASWKKYCPDYEIREWNEDNFDIHLFAYAEEAYNAKKWAFVTDVVRLYALVNFGGIYMDTDVQVIKSLDPLLDYEAVSGFEDSENIPTGLMACVKGQPFFDKLLHYYDDKHFLLPDGSFDTTTNVEIITELCVSKGLKRNNTKQTVEGFTLLPNEYLCPKDYKTGKINSTKNTLCIHHFDGSWLTEEEKYRDRRNQLFLRSKQQPLYYFPAVFTIIKYEGFGSFLKQAFGFVRRKLRKKR